MKKIFIYILALLIIAVNLLVAGTVFSFLWAWFIVPIFLLQPISILQSMGLILVVSYLTHQSRARKLTNEEALNLMKKNFIEQPFIYLVVGYGVKLIIGC